MCWKKCWYWYIVWQFIYHDRNWCEIKRYIDHGGSQSHNLQIRNLLPYPLSYMALLISQKINRQYQQNSLMMYKNDGKDYFCKKMYLLYEMMMWLKFIRKNSDTCYICNELFVEQKDGLIIPSLKGEKVRDHWH